MPITPERSRTVFRKLERDLVRLSSKRPAESVHSFRTGMRRLQTLLQDLIPDQDRNQEKLLKLLNRIRKRAGKVRDIDVQLSALRSLKVPEEPRRKSQLLNGLLELRAEDERKLRQSLNGKVVREIRRRLNRAESRLDLESAKDPMAVARNVLEQAPTAEGPPSADMLHQYRLLAKRARYTAEFAPESAQTERFIAELRTVQDALGDWHDWQLLTMSAAKRLGEMPTSPLVALLHNATGAKSRRALSTLASAESYRSLRKSTSPAKASRQKSAA